jgi:hypothetical protein
MPSRNKPITPKRRKTPKIVRAQDENSNKDKLAMSNTSNFPTLNLCLAAAL